LDGAPEGVRLEVRGADLEEVNLQNANLQGANLQGANLQKSNLFKANLRGADLQGANLRQANLARVDLWDADCQDASFYEANLYGAKLGGTINLTGATLPTGETWEVYLSEVVPALCQAGGRSLAEVAAAWDFHNWEGGCPMAVAFGVKGISEIPLLLQPRVKQFIFFFDSGLIPRPRESYER